MNPWFTCDVYLIWSLDGRCLYIGTSYRTVERIRDHERLWLDVDYVADVVTFETRLAAEQAEADLIYLLQPERNVEWKNGWSRHGIGSARRIVPPALKAVAS